MEGHPPALNQPASQASTTAAPTVHAPAEALFVVVPTWRWRIYLHPAMWALSLVTMVGCVFTAAVGLVLAMFAGGFIDAWASTTWSGAGWLVAIICWSTIVAAAWLTMRAIARSANRRGATSFASTIPLSEPARGFMIAELREAGPPKDGWSTWHARRWVDAVRGHSAARIYLSQRLAKQAAQFDRTDRPVEPERIGGSAGTSTIAVVLYSGLAAYFLWLAGIRSPTAWVFGFFAASSLVRLLRRRALFSPVIAGQGWIQHGDARWTVNDSVIVAGGWANARVRVVGPPGVLTMQLPAARGKDLEALWMRWMHPHPALEQQAFDA